ncbi:hypothetical protein H0H92_005484 [Tricholoma furcatifolium]|nr:hypothetical protein H0H92_005484 [Tricholoma furcatifolium]
MSRLLKLHMQIKESLIPLCDDIIQPSPLDFDPALIQIKSLITAAAAQLLAIVRIPHDQAFEFGSSMYLTTAVGFVVDTNIPDILLEGGPQLEFYDFSQPVISSGRLRLIPVASFDGAPLASVASGQADEALNSSVHFSKFIQKQTKAAAPFNAAHNTSAKLWEWYQEPENEIRSKRFIAAMTGGIERYPAELFVHGTGIKDLNGGDVVVDVGGSIGSCTLHLYKAFPNLNYVVQDLKNEITAADGYWKKNAPQAVPNGKVTLQVHDFFTPQPVKGAALYFLRVVIHDWPDHDAKVILKNLRDAAAKTSKLVLFDTLAYHICKDPAIETAAPKAPVPFPLLANLGIAGAGFETNLDMQMLNLVNGKERTEEEFRQLGLSVGWKLESIVRGPMNALTFSAV